MPEHFRPRKGQQGGLEGRGQFPPEYQHEERNCGSEWLASVRDGVKSTIIHYCTVGGCLVSVLS